MCPQPLPYSISPQWRAMRLDICSELPRQKDEIEAFLLKFYMILSGFKYYKGSINWMPPFIWP